MGEARNKQSVKKKISQKHFNKRPVLHADT
jgi:hypothetical protein